ncbi:hypothetical protein [Caballeronia cordobensis]|uniref:hypothetical protein n=1 Tax=Caballeronia cordobensis TaxID=1353886 RepID=UPI00128F589D|nr:hypothetical protein [Caballeronia cordobensis]
MSQQLVVARSVSSLSTRFDHSTIAFLLSLLGQQALVRRPRLFKCAHTPAQDKIRSGLVRAQPLALRFIRAMAATPKRTPA